MKVIDGGVTAAKGFQAAAAAAGIKYKDRTDMALIYSEKPCKAAGTFTTNLVKSGSCKVGSRDRGVKAETTGSDRKFRHCKCMYRRRGNEIL